MKPEAHFDVVGHQAEEQQALLPRDTQWFGIVGDCHLAAMHYLLAGVAWLGTNHERYGHAHGKVEKVLDDAGVPAAIRTAWHNLDVLRNGIAYGGAVDGKHSDQARALLAEIKAWVIGVRPANP